MLKLAAHCDTKGSYIQRNPMIIMQLNWQLQYVATPFIAENYQVLNQLIQKTTALWQVCDADSLRYLAPYITAVKTGEYCYLALTLQCEKMAYDCTLQLIPNHPLETGIFHLVMYDQTAEIQQVQQYAFEAKHDPLTGLLNRRYFMHRLEQILLGNVPLINFAVSFLDMNYFKQLNDQCGHVIGDAVLCQVGKKIQSHMQGLGLCARLAGDEFVMLFENLTNPIQQVTTVCQHIIAAINDIETCTTSIVKISASVGCVLLPCYCSLNSSDILRYADQAMYAAKQHRGSFVLLNLLDPNYRHE